MLLSIIPSSIFFIMTAALFVVKTVSSHDCSPPFENIKCECTAITAECFGTQKDSLEAEEIISNFSSIENVILQINDLHFETDFIFQNASIKNLTLGYGLQIPSSNFFTGLGSSLISLNLQNNSIKNINDSLFSSLSFLTELFLDKNEMQKLESKYFANLKSLKYLSIINNNAYEIDPEVLHSLPVQTLILSENKFLLIDNIILKTDSLLKLKIDNCLIEGLIKKDTFMDAPNIETLDISYNKLSGIEGHSFSALKYLMYLNVSYNAIEYLEENAFSETKNLTVLDLQGNQISIIKLTSFAKLHKLKYLDLSGNKLKAVLCEYTTDFTSLEEIYLQNNEIKTFTPGAFYYSPNLKVLNITSNNLECSCALTDSVLYLIENSTMESTYFQLFSCIISSTGSQLLITEYKSSKCIPVEPCKKLEVIEDEEYEYDYDDETSTINTITNEYLTNTTTHSSTEVSPLEASSATPISNTSSTLHTLDVNETDIVTNHQTETLEYNTSDASTMEGISTLSKDTDGTTPILATSQLSTISTNETQNVSQIFPDTTVATDFINIVSEEEITTLSIPTSKKVKTTYSSFNETKTSTSSSASTSECSSLHLSVGTLSSDSDITIFKNFSFDNNTFCLKWAVGGIKGIKIKCSIKYTTTSGTKVLNLVCPSSVYEVKIWSKNERIFKFCILIYPENKRKHDSCALLVSEREKSSTSVYLTTREIYFTSKPTYLTSQTYLSTRYTNLTTPTYLSTRSTYLTTKSSDLTTITSTTNTVYSESSTDTSVITTEKITTVLPTVPSSDFFITALDLYFNNSKLAYTKWTLNMQEYIYECKLTLKVSTQYFEEIEGVFPCKNNIYQLKNVKENDIFKVCLFSHHEISGKDHKCELTLPPAWANAQAGTQADDSINSSLIPLICLLILVGILIMFIVFKNIFKKRSDTNKYEVRAEEEKYQERVKLRPQSSQEESVRFSYIAKENHEYI